MGTSNLGWAAGFVRANASDDPLLDTIGGVWSPNNDFASVGLAYRARDINDKGEVVGTLLGPNPRRSAHSLSVIEKDAIICDSKGKNIRLLDAMLPKGSAHMTCAVSINDKGEIVCIGTNPNGWYLLRPTK